MTATRRLQRHQVLCVQNNKFQSLYAIEHGAVKAYRLDAQGREHIHAFYFPGEILGYRAIHAGHYLSTVVALSDTTVCEIPYEPLLETLKDNHELQKHLLSLLSKQLMIGAYVDAASAEQRIAAFIMDLSYRIHGAIPMKQVVLPMSRHDVGNYLGLTAETVSRLLSRFQQEGIIQIDRKVIRIINSERLQHYTE